MSVKYQNNSYHNPQLKVSGSHITLLQFRITSNFRRDLVPYHIYNMETVGVEPTSKILLLQHLHVLMVDLFSNKPLCCQSPLPERYS